MSKPSQVALVTGASRGIGAAVAQLLAHRGLDVVINYRSKRPRADAVAAQVRDTGQRATLAQADLTNSSALAQLAQLIEAEYGQLQLLVLNASGGMEKDKPATYAMDLNYTAQVRTVDAVLPLMPPGSTIIFVTSHWAHFYGKHLVMAAYEPVAKSKKAGEEALRARLPELSQRGIRLLVVSGDVIEGTITPKLLARAQPGAIVHRRDQAGPLPTVEDFARAIVDTALNPSLRNGATIYVGAIE